jgi:hypothetical protein
VKTFSFTALFLWLHFLFNHPFGDIISLVAPLIVFGSLEDMFMSYFSPKVLGLEKPFCLLYSVGQERPEF